MKYTQAGSYVHAKKSSMTPTPSRCVTQIQRYGYHAFAPGVNGGVGGEVEGNEGRPLHALYFITETDDKESCPGSPCRSSGPRPGSQ